MKKKTPAQFLFLGGEAVTFAFSGAVMFILISRVSGPELLGQYSLAFAWILVFQSIGNFGIPEFLMREFGRFREKENKYFSNGIILGLVTSVTAMLLMVGAVYLSSYDTEIQKALFLGALVLVPAMVNMICRGSFMAHKKTELILIVGLLETCLVLTVNVFLVLNGYGIAPLILTLLVGKSISSLASLYLFRRFTRNWKWEIDISFCKSLLPPIITFAASNVLGLISTRLNIIMLSWWGNLSVVGFYAAANKLVEFSLMLPSIFSQFMLPQIARTFSEKSGFELKKYKKSFYFLFAKAIVLGLGLIYFADSVVYLLFGKSFEESVIILRILLVFFLVESLDTVLTTVLKAAGRQNQDVRLFASNPATNILLNVILIPLYGGVGAAVARLVGGLASCLLRYLYVARHMVQFGWLRLMIKPFAICSLLVGCSFFLRGQVHFAVLGIAYLVLSASLIYWTHDTSM